MKLFILSLALLVSFSSHAGKMKELLIETDDAINYEMYKNADLSVEEISNHKLGSKDGLITVTADVVTRNPHNGKLGSWECVVSFKLENQVAEFSDIDCH